MQMQPAEILAAGQRTWPDEITDEALVARANAGRWSAFEVLVRRYQDEFHRLAWSYLKSDADAQDVVQMAFLKMYRKLQSYRGDASFKNWAYRIVINTALSRIRRHKRHREVALEAVCPSLEDVEQLSTDPTHWASYQWEARADDIVAHRELRGRIIDAVDQLEPKYQTVFLLYEVQALDLDEIGEITGLSIPGVKSRLHRARLFLRATLEHYLREYAPALLG